MGLPGRGDNLDKMSNSCMKIIKSTFLELAGRWEVARGPGGGGWKGGGAWGTSQLFESVGGSPH